MPVKKNISTIAAKRLCITCGACSGICPTCAIHFEETSGGYYLPVVDDVLCIKCGLCLDVCPGVRLGSTLMSNIPEDPFSGSSLVSFVGKSLDKEIYDNSQSGGIVTALLVHALKGELIGGALVVGMPAGNPPRPAAYIAQNREQLLRAQKSKYCPVPVLSLLKELKNFERPVAVVGTSCQIHGLYNVLDREAGLRKKVAFTIGIVCDRVLTLSAVDFLIKEAAGKVDRGAVNLHFRDKSVSGYPGDVHVFTDKGNSFVMKAKNRMRIKDYFTPVGCRLCFDKMNVFSDITVGDPHGLDGIDRKNGESLVIGRTKKGAEIIEEARANAEIQIRRVPYDEVLKGQSIDKRKEKWQGYSRAWMNSGRTTPHFFEQLKKHSKNVMEDADCRGICLKNCRKDIEYSMSLDKWNSKEKLIHFVNNKVRLKQLFKLFLLPARIAKRITRKGVRFNG